MRCVEGVPDECVHCRLFSCSYCRRAPGCKNSHAVRSLLVVMVTHLINTFTWRSFASVRAGTSGADRGVRRVAAFVGHTAGGEPLVMEPPWRCRHVFQAAAGGMARVATTSPAGNKQTPNGECNESACACLWVRK